MPGGTWVGENYVCCIFIVVIFMGGGEAGRGKEVLKSSYEGGGRPQSGWDQFLWGLVDRSSHHDDRLSVLCERMIVILMIVTS